MVQSCDVASARCWRWGSGPAGAGVGRSPPALCLPERFLPGHALSRIRGVEQVSTKSVSAVRAAQHAGERALLHLYTRCVIFAALVLADDTRRWWVRRTQMPPSLVQADAVRHRRLWARLCPERACSLRSPLSASMSKAVSLAPNDSAMINCVPPSGVMTVPFGKHAAHRPPPWRCRPAPLL